MTEKKSRILAWAVLSAILMGGYGGVNPVYADNEVIDSDGDKRIEAPVQDGNKVIIKGLEIAKVLADSDLGLDGVKVGNADEISNGNATVMNEYGFATGKNLYVGTNTTNLNDSKFYVNGESGALKAVGGKFTLNEKAELRLGKMTDTNKSVLENNYIDVIAYQKRDDNGDYDLYLKDENNQFQLLADDSFKEWEKKAWWGASAFNVNGEYRLTTRIPTTEGNDPKLFAVDGRIGYSVGEYSVITSSSTGIGDNTSNDDYEYLLRKANSGTIFSNGRDYTRIDGASIYSINFDPNSGVNNTARFYGATLRLARENNHAEDNQWTGEWTRSQTVLDAGSVEFVASHNTSDDHSEIIKYVTYIDSRGLDIRVGDDVYAKYTIDAITGFSVYDKGTDSRTNSLSEYGLEASHISVGTRDAMSTGGRFNSMFDVDDKGMVQAQGGMSIGKKEWIEWEVQDDNGKTDTEWKSLWKPTFDVDANGNVKATSSIAVGTYEKVGEEQNTEYVWNEKFKVDATGRVRTQGGISVGQYVGSGDNQSWKEVFSIDADGNTIIRGKLYADELIVGNTPAASETPSGNENRSGSLTSPINGTNSGNNATMAANSATNSASTANSAANNIDNNTLTAGNFTTTNADSTTTGSITSVKGTGQGVLDGSKLTLTDNTGTTELTAGGAVFTKDGQTTTIEGDKVTVKDTAGIEKSFNFSDMADVGGRIDGLSQNLGKMDDLDSALKDREEFTSNRSAIGAVNAEAAVRSEAVARLDKAIEAEAAERHADVARLDTRIDHIGDRIDKVGAMSAAMSSLKTLGYDPNVPTEFSVALGQYRDETGLAVGIFHYPNRNVMLNFSLSTAGGETMGGIGATWRIGHQSSQKRVEIRTTEDVEKVMVKKEDYEALREQVNQLTQVVQQLIADKEKEAAAK